MAKYCTNEQYKDLQETITEFACRAAQAASAILKHIYRPGYKYAIAGVMPMDQINQRFGRGNLVLGSAGGIGERPVWGMKQNGCRRRLRRLGRG